MTQTFVPTKEEVVAKWMTLLFPLLFLTNILFSVSAPLRGAKIPFFLVMHFVIAVVLGFYLSRSRFFTKDGPAYLRYATISFILSIFFGLLDSIFFGICGPFVQKLDGCGFAPGVGEIIQGSPLYFLNWGIIFICALTIMVLLQWAMSFNSGSKLSH